MEAHKIPLGQWGEQAIGYVVAHGHPAVAGFAWTVKALDGSLRDAFGALPPLAWIAIVALVAWRVSGRGVGAFAAAGLLLVWNQGLWEATILTVSLVLTASVLSLAVAIPVGVLMAESRRVEVVLDPVLDFIQTMPRFVYLIPAVVLLGIDVVPAVFATMTLAIPPAIRLTAVGLRQVDRDVVEAAVAFGASRRQVLVKVALPLALPTILLGVNQCLMMSLSMAVISSLIGAGGLGTEVLNGIAVLNAGQGVVAGFAIFVLAVITDRVTRGAAAGLSARRGRRT